MFKQINVDEESPLELLADSMPEVTFPELLSEIKETEELLRELVSAQQSSR